MTESCSCFTAKEKESEIDFGFVPRSSLERLIKKFCVKSLSLWSYHNVSLDVNKQFPYVAGSECQRLLPLLLYFLHGYFVFRHAMATESMLFESAQNNFIFPNHSSTFERLKGMSYVYTELEEKKTYRWTPSHDLQNFFIVVRNR